MTDEPAISSSRIAIKVRHVPGAPVVSVRVWLLAGARDESIPGLALVTGRALLEGSTDRDWVAISEEAESRGIAIAGFGGVEIIGLGIDALAEDWDLALEWAAELTLQPQFPAERVDWVARQAAAELRSMGDQPEVVTGWAFLKQLYTPHPRSRPTHGSAASLARILPEHCKEFHRGALERGIVVAASGWVDEDLMASKIQELFSGVRSRESKLEMRASIEGLDDSILEVSLDSGDQAHLLMGHLSLPLNHPDVPALQIAAVGLGAGSGLTGRIPQRIREKEGLAYSVGVEVLAGAGFDPGRLVIYVGTAPTSLKQAEAAVVEELDQLIVSGLAEQEFNDARSYLIGREPFHRETARQWADLAAETEIFGIPLDDESWVIDRWRNLTNSDVSRAIRSHLDLGKLKTTRGVPRL